MSEDKMSILIDFCRTAVETGPKSAGRAVVITANTLQKAIAAETPLPMDTARPYLIRCGYARILYHDTEDRYWDILMHLATKTLISIQPWDGPQPPESLLDTAFCVYDDYVH